MKSANVRARAIASDHQSQSSRHTRQRATSAFSADYDNRSLKGEVKQRNMSEQVDLMYIPSEQREKMGKPLQDRLLPLAEALKPNIEPVEEENQESEIEESSKKPNEPKTDPEM